MSDTIEKMYVPDGPEATARDAADKNAAIAAMVAKHGLDGIVCIPRAEYEALMALRQIIAEMAYARAPLNDRVYRECRTALAALRSAGIHETEGGER